MVGFYPKGEVEGNTAWRCEPGSDDDVVRA